MDAIEIEQLNILDIESVQEYSNLIMEVMSEFNKKEISEFQKVFASVEEIIGRKESDKKYDGFSTVQFIAKHNKKIIGVLEVESKYLIQSFFVKKEFQNKGVGKKLIDFSKKYFINNGFKIENYYVNSSKYAINIYKKLGFEGKDTWLCLTMKYKTSELLKIRCKKILRRITKLFTLPVALSCTKKHPA
jgi:ribosomal protein S18 acetylase RimI-like enzyme